MDCWFIHPFPWTFSSIIRSKKEKNLIKRFSNDTVKRIKEWFVFSIEGKEIGQRNGFAYCCKSRQCVLQRIINLFVVNNQFYSNWTKMNQIWLKERNNRNPQTTGCRFFCVWCILFLKKHVYSRLLWCLNFLDKRN